MMTSTRRKAVVIAIAAALARASASATAARDSANARTLIHQASTYGFKQTSDHDNTHDVSIVFGEDENGGATSSFVIDEDPEHMWEDADDEFEDADSCGEGCVDNPDFVSMMGLPCHGHSYFECGMFVQVGSTEEEVKALISNCPCSCQSCPTPEPSSDPTLSPTTSRPSASPVSSAPTSRPSSAPVVTSSPTTKSPTKAPTTLGPTTMPSFRPSSTPTLPPSTSSPTTSPTNTPTSTAPTSSPVQKMTATTRIQPIDASVETTCPTGYSGLIGSLDCKGAIQCADGVKLFGPIPCRSGPNGDLLFDIESQKCMIPSDGFVCQPLPKEGDDHEDEVAIVQTELNESSEKEGPASEPQTDLFLDSPTQPDIANSIQTPSPNTPDMPDISERIGTAEDAEGDGSDDVENNVLGPLSLKELIIISVGGGCLVLFIGMSVFFAARRKRCSAEERESQNNQGERQHNAGKSSSSTIDTDDATPTIEYYTYINKAMRNNRAVTNFSTSKQAWSTKREFLAEKKRQKSTSTVSEESSRQREDGTIDAQENGTVTASMRGDDKTVGADATSTVVSVDEGATEIAYKGSKAGKSFASAFGW